MSIAKRIKEAIDKMDTGDFEGALVPASIAADSTATQEYPGMKNNVAYKNFIHDNFEIISKVSSGGTVTIGNLMLKYNHPDIIPDQDGMCSIEQILYHVVRCGLLHKATLPSNLKFINKGMIKVENNLLILPAGFIYGLLAAVVVSPSNKDQFISSTSVFNIHGNTIPLNELWGNKEKLLKLYVRQPDNKSQSQHQEINIGAPPKLRNEKVVDSMEVGSENMNNAEYKNFLQKTVNDIDELVANIKIKAHFQEQIKTLCSTVESYGQMLDKYGNAANKKYASEKYLQRAKKEAEEAEKELIKIEAEWPETYRKYGESDITRKLSDRCRELRNMCGPSPADKSYRDGPPAENHIWNNYWDNEYVKCPWDTFWPVFWRPPEPTNPLWWFPYSSGTSLRPLNDSEKLMRDYVLLAAVHDECLRSQDPAGRLIYRDQPYGGIYFEHNKFFCDLWQKLKDDKNSKSLIERAMVHVKRDISKNVEPTRDITPEKHTTADFIPYQIDIMERIAENLKDYADNAPNSQSLTNDQLFQYQLRLVKCFGQFNYAMIWLRDNKYEKDADYLENQRRKILDDIREIVDATQNGSKGFWPDKVTIEAVNLSRKLKVIANKSRKSVDKLKRILAGFKRFFFELWQRMMKSFFDSAMNR